MLSFVLWDDATETELGAVDVTSDKQLWEPSVGAWHLIVGPAAARTLAIVGGVLSEVDRAHPVDVALALARRSRLDDAKAHRDTRQSAGFASAIGRVDTDFERALPLINNMAAAAAGAIAAKTTFPLKKWTLADGSQADLTATKGVAMGAGVIAMLDACQQAYVVVKAGLNAATTPAAIAAIDITAGYPA